MDTKPDPAHPKLIRTIEADELAKRAGYSRPHTVHCGPEGIYVSALADAEGKRPGGVFLMDHESFDVRGRWELDRGPQELAYDFWWHLGYDTMVTSEWGTPDMFEDGLIPEKILGSEYGHASAYNCGDRGVVYCIVRYSYPNSRTSETASLTRSAAPLSFTGQRVTTTLPI